jgi:hypothetical protein
MRVNRTKRILFTTSCQTEPYDYLASNRTVEDLTQIRFERRISFGLRFLQANLPEIEILEYPTWREYCRILKLGWDIIGFSFYANEIPTIKQMTVMARRANIKELWGGNYGVLTPATAGLFDRIARGYAEKEVADWLGYGPKEIIHPPLIALFELRRLGLISLGILFTMRGCNRRCTFCQTPAFCGNRLEPLPLKPLKEVIAEYVRLRAGAILILDECFGILPEHAEEVIRVLHQSGLPWLSMTRADILSSQLSEWGPRGMSGALIGIESLQGRHLKGIRKDSHLESTKAVIKRLHSEDRLVIGFHMIGFEDDTVRSLQNELHELANLNLDFTQICILTPFHQTALWNQFQEKYSIDESDLSKFDGKHLVWNHPHFTADKLEQILRDFYKVCNSPQRDAETIRRFARLALRRSGIEAGLSHLAGAFILANAGKTN